METNHPLDAETESRPIEAPGAIAIIRTPDQRVRVFISSTLDELAPERQAAREAIAQLRLTAPIQAAIVVRNRRNVDPGLPPAASWAIEFVGTDIN